MTTNGILPKKKYYDVTKNFAVRFKIEQLSVHIFKQTNCRYEIKRTTKSKERTTKGERASFTLIYETTGIT
jgi:hypothetical protein